jgi:hypothetical protein
MGESPQVLQDIRLVLPTSKYNQSMGDGALCMITSLKQLNSYSVMTVNFLTSFFAAW